MGLEDNRNEIPSEIGEVADSPNRDLLKDFKDKTNLHLGQFNDCVERFEQKLRFLSLWFMAAILAAMAVIFVVSAYYVLSVGTTYEGRVIFFLLATASQALGVALTQKLRS